jgi:acylglycerol lipase
VPHRPVPLRAVPATTLSRLPENAALYAADPMIYKGRLTNLTARTALLTAADVWRRAAEWTVPTLLVHGTDDSSTDPEGSKALFRAIASTDKTLDLVEGGRHELLNDLERDRVRDTVLEWSRTHVAG